MAIFGRGPLNRLFGAGATTAPANAPVAVRGAAPPEEHGTIEDWFVRTARSLLGRERVAGEKRPSRLEQKLATLEQENALLKDDNRRLADEVAALRTLVFVRRP